MNDPKLAQKVTEIQALLNAIKATATPDRIYQHLREIRSTADYLLRRAK